ncbi:MAG: carbonic anhydrase [Flavobacterium sp.]|nr:carbonic anhydrase [Flavobacterium sp.]
MKTIKLFSLLMLTFTTICIGQNKKKSKNAKEITYENVVNDEKLRKEYYIVDRDSAYADPRIGLKKLMGGNKRFFEGKSIKPRQSGETIRELESGQAPFATIVGCADSRVPNELIFDQGLGDLFIIRTAGQVSAAASYGSMEFAVTKLKTKLIVVLGHTECGAVAAAVSRPENVPGHIVTLINEIKPAVRKCMHLPGDPVNNAVRQNVIDQVNNLRDLDPILYQSYKKGEILIVGAVYDIHTGKVEFLEETLMNLPLPAQYRN